MEVEFITHKGASRLILVFAGWSMDARPFGSLHRDGYDIAVVWDYRDCCIDWTFALPYTEICIVAWSLGVYAAATSTAAIESRVTRRIAVNGTISPVDDSLGIPEAIFRGTLDGLDERNLLKFYRRMAGSKQAYEAFMAVRPDRDIESLRSELDAFCRLPEPDFGPVTRWDVAVIGRADAIFPPANQTRAWASTATEILDAPHLVDLQAVIDRHIVDKDRMGQRFARGRKSYDDFAPVQAECVDRLCSMMHDNSIDAVISRPGARVLEIGCGTGTLSRRLARLRGADTSLELWDIVGPAPVECDGVTFRQVDAETEIMRLDSESVDVIASASTVQWFNSPSRFFAECARVLVPGGYLALTTFVSGNLQEVADATGRSLPLPDRDGWLAMTDGLLDVIGCECYERCMLFDQPLDVFRHLKSTGVNSLDSSDSHSLRSAAKRLRADDDGRYRATYRPIILLMKKK